MLLPLVSYAQPQIDSIHIVMKNLEVQHIHDDNGGGFGMSTPDNWTKTELLNQERTFNIFKEAVSSDTLSLVDSNLYYGFVFRAEIIYDSIFKVVRSINYSSSTEDQYFGISNNFEITNAFIRNDSGQISSVPGKQELDSGKIFLSFSPTFYIFRWWSLF